MNNDYIFETRLEVRDYECDIEGIVNNANAEMHEQGTDAVVVRMNLEYKAPLRCDDIIVSRLRLEKQGIRYIFVHDLFREADGKLCFRGRVELVTLVHGRLAVSEDYDRAFAPYLSKE